MAPSVVPSPSVPLALLEAVVSYFQPHRVILFGSLARGDGGMGSDIDLVVELDDDTPPEMMSAKAIQAAREGYHDPVDIIPYRVSVMAVLEPWSLLSARHNCMAWREEGLRGLPARENTNVFGVIII